MTRFDAHRFLYRASLSISNAFVFTLLFSYFGSLALAALLYAISQVVTLVLTPYSARFVSRGTVRMMSSATTVLAVSFVVLALFFGVDRISEAYVAASAALFFALVYGAARALYWTPYRLHTDAHAHAYGGTLFIAIRETLLALLPFLAGYIIVEIGTPWLFWAAAVFTALSIIFLVREKNVAENYSLSYMETWKVFWAPELRPILRSSVAEGVHAGGLFFVWPIAALVLLSGSYMLLGAVISIVLLLTLIVRIVMGHLSPTGLFKFSPHMHATLSGFAWIMRVIIITPIQLIAVDVFHNLRYARGDNSIDPLTFEQAADGGSIVDEYSAIKEMGFAIGRLKIAVLVIVLSLFLTLTQTLVVAIAITGLVSILAPYLTKPRGA